jgi:succinyl-CoA synthetase alpha subunit
MMGPGAGTAILNNVALGFANVLPSGPVGIVSAAGTGLQEVSTLLARMGVGISQGLGTGGRDLNEKVGGIMMLEALKALINDNNTEVIILISKPPAKQVASSILELVASGDKPAVVCFMGGEIESFKGYRNVVTAETLQEAALQTARLVGDIELDVGEIVSTETNSLKDQANLLKTRLVSQQKYVRGLFSGGTLCYETQVIWKNSFDMQIYSNAPLSSSKILPDSSKSIGNSFIDMGEEEFTVGRPHPMIDNDLRIRRIYQEARDSEVAVILLDMVLGYGAHDDPAGEIGVCIKEVKMQADLERRELIVICSVTGTKDDPQIREDQISKLIESGSIVCESNAAAAQLAGMIVS